jgi:serine/threonine-protein kinase
MVVSGPHAGHHWSFDRPVRVVVGRTAPAQLRLAEEPALSASHCELTVDPPTVSISDLASTNGTLVNGIPIAEAVLVDGDEFGVGETRIRVCITNHTSPTALAVGDLRGTDAATGTLVLKHGEVDLRRVNLRGSTAAAISPGGAVGDPLAETEPIFSSGGLFGAEPSRVPEACGPYLIEEQIGEGGMATVYRGRHRKTGQRVAIKLIRSVAAPSDKMLQLFVREASVLLRLNHPRIVRSIEFGFQDQQPFLVLEWLPVIDLLEFIDPLPIAQKVRLSCWGISRVLQALEYAHSQGFVHRDVKPNNILAYREGHRLQVKLGDFGLAKCHEDAGLSAMTDDGSVRGTLAYMSPEQIQDSRSVGPQSDLFSVGACLYRLLTGLHPRLTAQGVRCDPATLKAANLPSPLIRLIEASMQPDTNQRPKSAAVMQQQLQPYHGK